MIKCVDVQINYNLIISVKIEAKLCLSGWSIFLTNVSTFPC